ncbi:MAG TPA: PAS domain S-box protein, partial [Longimicrobium sp.]|nr:PAS domain S-box protein [Longimicrobium sp.]
RVLAGEISGYSMEKRYLRPDGGAVWADLTVAPVRDEAGKPAYFVSVVHDIQARKEAERRLAESEARLRFLSEMIPQMVWSTRPDGFHDYYNSRWFEYTGLSYEDSSGPGWMEVLHPDDRERAGRRWLHSLRTGEPYSIEYRFRRRDGEYRWFLGLAAPLRGVDGGIERWFGTCTDIQEQKDLERSLRDARERLEAALDASATGTFRWDLRTGAVECDAALAGVFGIAPDRVPVSPRGFLELLHPDERERVAAAARRIGAGEGSFEVELRVLLADGGARWVLTKGRTRVDDGGRPLCVSGACVDITDRKTAELEREALLRAAQAARGDAETASELKSRFVATMSHEIRTPINAVLGYADLLEMGVSGPLNDAQGEQVRRILRSGRHLLALVNDALDMAKIEAGEMHVARAPVDARSLCRGVLELTEPLCASRSIMVVDATQELEGAAVWGDEDRIRQILVNLLTNACKFTPPRRAVRIGWSAAHRPPESVTSEWTGRWLGIEVEDAGPGIAPEMHEAVFAPFVQDEAGREAGQGTGLGLAISRTLARMMGGEVTLRSAPGEGSCFTLWLQAETEP